MLPRSPTYSHARIQVDNSLRALTAARRHKVAEHQNHIREQIAKGKRPSRRKPWILTRFDLRIRKLRALSDRLFIEQVQQQSKKQVRIHKDLRELVNAPLRGLL